LCTSFSKTDVKHGLGTRPLAATDEFADEGVGARQRRGEARIFDPSIVSRKEAGAHDRRA
ncbi:unnamed protein product, partial [Scytosiphon promiscuus]